MILSDLNYLEIVDQATGIVGGGGVRFDSRVRDRRDLDIRRKLDIDTKVRAKADFSGNFASVSGTADALGKDTYTDIVGGTQTVENKSSESFLDAISISK
ncbi:MAG: hypothetical protein IGR93_18915 [Hydrococcus sp. C42_A2020_068]|uniref:hypothetical protein n=1 Tax=Pleurocapsa sp. PCC 7327 TaxID=118163 RepID=UPI00029FF4B9|nr:hypothetical protein [Pleurocapsa sp. PCC 7327]AFY75612.1 hypothetical protein Ple7327_0128 [Pleurocapsa sp. PCC 7327]MBF2022105.1 hypothetical protein [Hydrococcus sp. C42_A2020_068]